MDGFLTPVSTTYTNPGRRTDNSFLLQEVHTDKKTKTTLPSAPDRPSFSAASAEEALEVLRSEPDYDTLVSVLRYLLSGHASVNVRSPGPVAAQIVQVLVTAILPNYWILLHEEDVDLHRLLRCLSSITGLSAVLVRLRALLAEAKTTGNTGNKEKTAIENAPADPTWQLQMLLQVLSEILEPETALVDLWTASVVGIEGDARRRPLAQEFTNILGSGRIVSLAAEAEAVTKEKSSNKLDSSSWVASGKEFSRWLVQGIVRWSLDTKLEDQETAKLCGNLLGKALRLGYPDQVVAILVTDLLLPVNSERIFDKLIDQLSAQEQKRIVTEVLKYISQNFLSANEDDYSSSVSAAAGLIKTMVGNNRVLHGHLTSWLFASPAVEIENAIGIRRAVVAVVALDKNGVTDVLEKSMAEFSDPLFIKYAPVLLQEGKAQVLLLLAGYVYRNSPRMLTSMLRSHTYLHAVSNRLSTSQNRARFLGMAVGEALSSLVDDSKNKLDFHMDEMDSDDAKWYKGLVHVSDEIGSVDVLRAQAAKTADKHEHKRKTKPKPASKQKRPANNPPKRPPVIPKTSGFVIEELDSDDDNDEHETKKDKDEDDDLVAYAKPDSDAEDSDDDPTMIRRDKPKAPVYIRDLLVYFRDTESYDRQRLALTTAPVLIRRKATFGTEVQQHALDLAAQLIGLHDTYDMDDFYQLHLQGMVALVVAQTKLVGPRFSVLFFEGDYSLAQRASILTALGLAGRELAGFETSEYASEAAFPSKQLPDRVERLYLSPSSSTSASKSLSSSSLKALPRGALDSIADSLTAGFLGPIAAKAADDVTGPDALKLTSFKARNDALQKKASLQKNGAATKQPQKNKANTSGPVIASALFFPLVARFQLVIQASTSSARMRRVLLDPSLLSLYLKTLAVLLHAVGPGAMALPDMTAELWRLLLGSSVQAQCVGDALVTHAVLFSVLALLDVNEARMRELCRDLPREVVQTRDWALQVVEATGGGGGSGGPASSSGDSQEKDIQMLAAGVYLRLTEGMESYRSFLLGEMVG